jgi:hypothetical protein
MRSRLLHFSVDQDEQRQRRRAHLDVHTAAAIAWAFGHDRPANTRPAPLCRQCAKTRDHSPTRCGRRAHLSFVYTDQFSLTAEVEAI